MAQTDPAPVACSLDRDELGAQLERWQELAARTEAGVTQTESGLQLTFRALPGVQAELESLVALERSCCRFADWSIRRDDGRLLLDINADGDIAIAAVQAMFAGLSIPIKNPPAGSQDDGPPTRAER
jgi:hypothetical protein